MKATIGWTMKRFIAVALLCAQQCTLCVGTQINSCEEVKAIGEVTSLTVSGCETSTAESRCKLLRGSHVKMELKFTIPEELCQSKVAVKGRLGPVDAPFQSGPATNFGLPKNCVSKGEEHTLTYDIFVQPFYPTINVGVKVELSGVTGSGSEKTAFCVMIPSTIKQY